jgi:hypothetical protein
VYRFAGEILKRAWEQTRDEKYLAALEQKAERILAVRPRYSDDFSNRILFIRDTFPANYVAARGESDAAKALAEKLKAAAAEDLAKLRSLQKSDGMWGFSPTASTDPKDPDPAPTALALSALAAMGFDDRDAGR